MSSDRLVYQEIAHLNDDLLLPWLDLYETAFPPNERYLVSYILSSLKAKEGGNPGFEHFLAVLNQEGKFIGMAMYVLFLENQVAALWYLAVHPSERNKGHGGKIYQEIIHRVDPARYKALLFDVEIPEREKTAEAFRRIEFYRRQGARLMGGIQYTMSVGWHQPVTPFNIMIHPLQPVDVDSAFLLAKLIYKDALQQKGPIRLD